MDLPDFSDHINPRASRQFFETHQVFPPFVTSEETEESLNLRIVGLERLLNEQFQEDVESEQIVHEIGFLHSRMLELSSLAIKES